MNLKELQNIYKTTILDMATKHHVKNDIRIFGSVARGDDNSSSDVDFLINLEPNASLLDLSGLRIDLEELLGCHVDVIPENSLHWVIKDQVLEEAVPL